eukprot:scaffold16837_cov82-Skeletonema_dohrnii-CCMP3373.AAC.3
MPSTERSCPKTSTSCALLPLALRYLKCWVQHGQKSRVGTGDGLDDGFTVNSSGRRYGRQ